MCSRLLSNTLDIHFCVTALRMALAIFNTDQGSQFTSLELTSIPLNAGARRTTYGQPSRWWHFSPTGGEATHTNLIGLARRQETSLSRPETGSLSLRNARDKRCCPERSALFVSPFIPAKRGREVSFAFNPRVFFRQG
jgi:hypothetical protein